MRASDEVADTSEVTLLSSIWRHKWLVAVLAVLAAAIGLAFSVSRSAEYEASAGLLLQIPRSDLLNSAPAAGDQRRYVADQVAIMRSAAVSELASVIAAEEGATLSSGAIRGATSVIVNDESNFVEIRVRSTDPEKARAGANAVVAGYRQVVRESLEEEATGASDRINATIEQLTAEIDALANAETSKTPAQQQVTAIIGELAELRNSVNSPATIAAQAEQLTSELRAWLVVVESEGLAGTPSDRELNRSVDLLDQLQTEQNRLKVDAEVASNAVAVFSPAGPGKQRGASSLSVLLISVFLGGVVAAGVAYWLDVRRQSFTDQLQPRRVLDAPVLATLPTLAREGHEVPLPAIRTDGSPAAEQFRILAFDLVASLGLSGTAIGESRGSTARVRQQGGSQDTPATRDRRADASGVQRAVAIVSPTSGQGSTTVAANTALAAAQQGRKVLVIDADIHSSRLSTALLNARTGRLDEANMSTRRSLLSTGLAQFLLDESAPGTDLAVADFASGGSLWLMPPGLAGAENMSLFRPEQMDLALGLLSDWYDLIIVDVPPMLEVAYAGAILRGTGAALIVVRQNSRVAALQDVRSRLDRLGARVIGYVYNNAPSRGGPAPLATQSFRVDEPSTR